MTFYLSLEERAAAPHRTQDATPSKVHARRLGHGKRRTRESTNRDRQGWDIFRKAHPMKHETARDRRRKTAEALENILYADWTGPKKLNWTQMVWLRRAVRQLRTDRIR